MKNIGNSACLQMGQDKCVGLVLLNVLISEFEISEEIIINCFLNMKNKNLENVI